MESQTSVNGIDDGATTTEENAPEKLLKLVQSRDSSEHDRGLKEIEKLLEVCAHISHSSDDSVRVENSKEALQEIMSLVIQNLQRLNWTADNEESIEGKTSEELWAAKHGCLSASMRLITRLNCTDLTAAESQFMYDLQQVTMRLVSDDDVRVRLQASDVMGALCKQLGPKVYEEFQEMICDVIKAEIEGTFHGDDGGTVTGNGMETIEMDEQQQQRPEGCNGSPTKENVTSANSIDQQQQLPNALHKNEEVVPPYLQRITAFEASPKGVRSSKLETYLKLLISVVSALESKFRPYVTEDLLEMVLSSLQHSNRFVREAGFTLCSVLLESDCIDYDTHGLKLGDCVSRGLSDLCSQTRIAAAKATRKHILHVPAADREKFYPILLPRLCLCRYFMADTKFLLYSQESWRLIVDTDGPRLVEKYLSDVVQYYIEATQSDNHAVREAACACIAELSRKINPVPVRQYIPQLLDALKRSFHDERWHVRDAACLGSANFILHFPEECRSESDGLLALYYENLGFPISVVRQGAASSIASAVKAYPNEIVHSVIERIKFGLDGVSKQLPDDTYRVTALTISPETRYSYPPGPWSQFLPYARPSQPWEFGDGCLYLIGDLSTVPECQSQLAPLIPVIIKSCQARTYHQHHVFLETMCKIVPPLAKGIGKRQFKEFLDNFFEPIFYSIECKNPQTAAAGNLCLQQLALMYGPNILKSRIEQFDSRLVRYMEGSCRNDK